MIQALDIVKRVNRYIPWPIPSTIEGDLDNDDRKTAKVLQAVNDIGQKLGSYYYWRWLYREGTIRTIAKCSAGDVDVVSGSPIVTSSASPGWTSSMVGRIFKVNAFSEIYDIKRVESGAKLELTTAFNGTTAIDLAYVIGVRRYPLPHDFDSELGFFQFVSPRNIELIDPIQQDINYYGPGPTSALGASSALNTGNVIRATIRGPGDDGRLILELDRAADTPYQIRFNYYGLIQEFVHDQDTWPFSSKYINVIQDGALAILRENAQDDNRATFDYRKFFQGRDELAGLRRPTDVFTRIQPSTVKIRLNRYRRRISTGRFDLGELFDRLP